MRIFKHRSFNQWAKSEGIADSTLKEAVEEMEKGLYEGNLGSCLYKKRVALPGKGKRGSYRTLIAFTQGKNAFFVYGFAKNVRADIDEKEEKIYRQLAKDFLSMSEDTIKKMVEKCKLFEVL
jgi:hypothetical protein